jgi:ABC-2 type transport system permease protein
VFASAGPSDGLAPKVEIMIAMAAFGAMGAVLMSTGPRLAAEREVGWLRQLRLTPLTWRAVLAARVAAAMILTLPAIGLTFAVAVAVNGVHLEVGQWAAATALLGIGCLPFAALGVLIGLIAVDGATAMGFTMVVYLAFAALGGLWVPTNVLPASLRRVAGALPSHAMAELGWRVAAGAGPSLGAAVVVCAWLVGAAVIAMLASRRGA